MRKVLLSLCLAAAMASVCAAEPLTLEQAGAVLAPMTLEAGINDVYYSYDKTELTDAAGTVVNKITTSATVVPVFGRFAFNDRIEAMLSIPYATGVSAKVETAAGVSTSDTSESGLADPVIGGKYVILNGDIKLGAGLNVSLPLGDKKFREGINAKPYVAAQKEIGPVTANANLSYTYTGEYDSDTTPAVKIDQGDKVGIGLGVEYPMMNKALTLIGEATFVTLGDLKTAGATVSDSSGSRIDGIVGARYAFGDFKTKLGVSIALGDEKTRAYDYKVFTGITYLIKM